MNPNDTKVLGVLVTGKTPDRYPLARKAVEAWTKQNYPGERSLLVINDHPRERLFQPGEHPEGVHEIDPGAPAGRPASLGELRNIGIDVAANTDVDYIVQWDDDDYSHENRLAYQVINTPPGKTSIFRWEIHCNLLSGQAFANNGQEVRCKGFPGTMMWPASAEARFRDIGKAEDTEFVLELRHETGVIILKNDPCMYFRCYHGHNTWSEKHVMKRKKGSRDLNNVERAYVDHLLQGTYAELVEALRAEAG